MALRERRMKVNAEDFQKSKENVLYRKKEGVPEGMLSHHHLFIQATLTSGSLSNLIIIQFMPLCALIWSIDVGMYL